jgi:hypothetical protein
LYDRRFFSAGDTSLETQVFKGFVYPNDVAHESWYWLLVDVWADFARHADHCRQRNHRKFVPDRVVPGDLLPKSEALK